MGHPFTDVVHKSLKPSQCCSPSCRGFGVYTCQIQLSVISVQVEVYTMLKNNVTKGKGVNGKEFWT